MAEIESLKEPQQTRPPIMPEDVEKERNMTMASLKNMFAEMAEIDNDPNSQKSIDYYKKLEKLERNDGKKKATQITIKTVRRGKS